jgi:predicted metal-dependent HD superfamily phosphohydrolase
MNEHTEEIANPVAGHDDRTAVAKGSVPEELLARFRCAAVAAGATRSCDEVFVELVARYREPHRHYHTLGHIGACLVWLDWFSGSATRPEEVELALWFHDAVYGLGATANEHHSAELARERLTTLGVRREAVDRIVAHIEATARHEASGGDAGLVVDLDLTVLGARRRDFDVFEQHIRLEYAHVADAVYRAARRRVLEDFLSRAQIYQTVPLRGEFEAPARANLERRIRELSDAGD